MSAIKQPLPPPRQIRFVNNPGQPPSKRRRIDAACLTCRRRKTRCPGERPACSTCTNNGHVCLGYGSGSIERRKGHNSDASLGSVVGPFEETVMGELGKSEDDDEESDAPVVRNASLGNGTAPKRHISEAAQRRGAGSSPLSPVRRRRASGNDLHPRHGQPNEWEATWRPPDHQRQSESPQEGHTTINVERGHHRRSVEFQSSSHGSIGSHGGHGSPTRPPSGQQDSHHLNESHRVPYFRYFGPTAIVPGYKQMVVDVSSRDRRRSCGSSFYTSSPNASPAETNLSQLRRQQRQQSSNLNTPLESPADLPVYDPDDPGQVHPLIIIFISIFFKHLGCNYPFMCEKRVIRKLRDKLMEPILVDAMCALAARFADLPILAEKSDGGEEGDRGNGMTRSEIGSFYAQRARAATVDTFPCPSVAAVQACLLMAYEGFGADQDSALWMYLGISIRMAVDLGLQKTISVGTTQGQNNAWLVRSWNGHESGDGDDEAGGAQDGPLSIRKHDSSHSGQHTADEGNGRQNEAAGDEEMRVETQERADTFWAIFFLDRVISSGTGRPVTFRDDDFDVAFPETVLDPETRRPAPFPVLVQIIHLYGRVSDVLNNIRNVDDLTREKMKSLGQMESDLTRLYQRQDPQLNFNAANFQAYVRAGHGTTFILFHFWFHALIIILHQPTLLTPFGSLHRRHQLRPNSHELSMSSAKTIADILAFAELIDPKSFIGNPFTSQPMYIAACAFLTESIANSSLPASRSASPGAEIRSEGASARVSAKHSLLAANANQNYQRCYKSLQQLHVYWGGVRYILSALDQKAKGIWDCETFTVEELQSKGSLGQIPGFDSPGPHNAPPIAWSLTGTSNSANPSLTVLFQSLPAGHAKQKPLHKKKRQHPTKAPHQPDKALGLDTSPGYVSCDATSSIISPTAPTVLRQAHISAGCSSTRVSQQQTFAYSGHPTQDQTHEVYKSYGVMDDESLVELALDEQNLGLFCHDDTAYHQGQYHDGQHHNQSLQQNVGLDQLGRASTHGEAAGTPMGLRSSFPTPPLPLQSTEFGHGDRSSCGDPYAYAETGPTEMITFDSQEVDISQVPLADIMPQWLEYLPSTVLDLFDGSPSTNQ